MFALWLSCVVAALVAVRGTSGKPVEEFVVDGQEVYPPGEYPYQCVVYANNGNDFYCGCVLITSWHVLTAAHCAEQPFPSYRIHLGVHDRITMVDGQPEIFSLSAIVLHPEWVNSGLQGFPNDIAVLTLSQEVNIAANPYIDIALPPLAGNESTVDFVGDHCNIIGWGRVSGNGELPNNLRQATMDVLSNNNCAARWAPYPILDGHICVFDLATQTESACNGDSGGCLICHYDGQAQWMLAGLMSWLRTGCLPEWPSVFTRVSYYRDWVEEVIGGNTTLIGGF